MKEIGRDRIYLRPPTVQMPEEELVELKFRLYDGTDIGPNQYSAGLTVGMLKDRIVSEWPRGKTISAIRLDRSI